MPHKASKVQECDATKADTYSIARYIKMTVLQMPTKTYNALNKQ